MTYYFYRPGNILSEYIRYIWIFEGIKNNREEYILPNASLELIINLSNAPKFKDNKTADFTEFREAGISGIKQHYFIIKAENHYRMAGICFKPATAHRLLRIPLKEFRDRVTEIDKIEKLNIRELQEKALYLKNNQEIFSLLENWLFREMDLEKNHQDIYRKIMLKIYQNQFSSTRKLAEDTGISQKHLINSFNKYIGLSPKQVYRLFRFQKLLKDTENNQDIIWQDLVYKYKFSDQAHFINDFKDITSFSPSEYIRLHKQSAYHIETG